MQLLVFAVVAVSALVIAYAIGIGGTVGTVIMLTILFVGGLLHVSRPIIERLR